jgi:hypothetical protein
MPLRCSGAGARPFIAALTAISQASKTPGDETGGEGIFVGHECLRIWLKGSGMGGRHGAVARGRRRGEDRRRRSRVGWCRRGRRRSESNRRL